MDLIVREAEPNDAAGIIEILNPIILAGSYTALDTPFSLQQERDFIANFPSRGIFHVAIDDRGQVVGFQNVEPFAAYTHAFDHVGVIGTYVSLQRRRHGVASELFSHTVRAALDKNYEKFFAFVRADNPAALATYRRHGFKAIGTARRHAKVNGRYVDEVMIERFLAI